ncbi:serine hydrolase domain-containing protein [Desulforhopalus sp. 52FAK]
MDTEMREDIHTSLETLVYKNIKNNVFSACSVGVADARKGKGGNAVFNYGNSGGSSAHLVNNKTVFDLASLTKPLVTTLSILSLVESGTLQLSDKITDYLKLEGDGTRDIRIEHLLEHTSGLAAHFEYFRSLIVLDEQIRENKLFSYIEREKLLTKPGTKEEYSDIGYIILGKLVEKLSGKRLSDYWEKEIICPLGLEKELYFAKNKDMSGIVFPTTGSCMWTKLELSGLVHDDNCRSIGGVAGHAGLFGTTKGLLTLIETLFKMYDNSYSHPSFSFDGVKERLKGDHGRFILGFDTPTGDTPSSGKYFSSRTLGHLGFTGTSFWMDCDQKIAVVLLTNRVLCGEDLTGIREFRPAVHDLIMKKLTPVTGR